MAIPDWLIARGRHLSTGEAAAILGVSRMAVNRYCASDQIKAFRVTDTGHWRIPVDSLIEFQTSLGWPLNWEALLPKPSDLD